jgi:hypothetical protein
MRVEDQNHRVQKLGNIRITCHLITTQQLDEALKLQNQPHSDLFMNPTYKSPAFSVKSGNCPLLNAQVVPPSLTRTIFFS